MRALIIGLLLFSLVSQNVMADSLPQRKPGLWEITVSSQSSGEMTMKHCTDPSTDSRLMQMGDDMAGQAGVKCSKNETRKEGAKYVIENDCTFGNSRINTTTVFSGDFSSTYTGVVNTTYSPPLMGKSANTSTVMAKWLGACQGDQAPGDIVMPDGMKMNINSMKSILSGAMEAAQRRSGQ